MNSKTNLKNFINNRYFQSFLFGALITVIFIFVWDSPIKRFNFAFEPNMIRNSGEVTFWFCDDFDNDGNSEKLRCSISSSSNRFSIVAVDHFDKYICDFDLTNDFWSPALQPAILDINNDSIKEFVFFSLLEDSIFLNAVNIFNSKMVIDHLFFSTIELHHENLGVNSQFKEINDFDKDGQHELWFSFDAGYGLYPRGIFKLNLTTKEFTFPPKTYIPTIINSFIDITNDGIPEILTCTYSPCNINFATEFHDRQSYIIVYDLNLEPLFPPIKMRGEYSTVLCQTQETDSTFYSVYISRSDTIHSHKMMVISKSGKIILQHDLPDIDPENDRISLFVINKNPYLFIDNYGKYLLTPTLANIPKLLKPEKKNKFYAPRQIIDLDQDGTDEQIIIENNENIVIYNEHFNYNSTLKIPFALNYFFNVSPYLKNGKIEKYFLTSNSSFTYFYYSKNPYYFTIYLLYAAIFLVFSGIIFLLLFFQKMNIEKKWQIEKQLSELQFNSVKNQLNPHFMFNSLNSVAYLINNGQKDEAYDFLTINSRMIQRMMNDANEVKRTLSDEIQFTRDYLQIQEHRFKERFKSTFVISPEVNMKFNVPKMCIHTYVENAVKHGFRNTKADGLLEITISPIENGVQIWVSDNGMGRKEAEKYNDSTKQGLKIMDEFYRLFEKYHDYSITSKIIDFNLKNDSQTGMRVKLIIRKKES